MRSTFVKIIYRKNDNFDLALRKWLFCNAKPTLLPCKTAAFGTQNNRFYNALITNELHKSYAYEKLLHYYRLFSAYETKNTRVAKQTAKGFFLFGKAKLYIGIR
ncbi:hypothetical protein PIN17_A0539 [Prevotella intermedia 17]|nr:hypothetical protein PIN17_A0539 [Prevotella intermedia 17]